MKIPKHALKPLAVLVAGGLLWGAWLMLGQGSADNTLSFTGSVEADQVDLSPEITGNVMAVSADEGEEVKKGQLLMVLDTSDYAIKLDMARSALKVAQLAASDLSDGNTGSQVRQARAGAEAIGEQLSGAAVELEYLKTDLVRIQALYDSGAASEQQLDSAERALEKGQSAYQALLKQKSAQDAVLAQVQEGATNQVRQSAEEQVRIRQLEIQDLERTIGKGQLSAPMDGVVQSVNYSAGERVAPGQRVVTLLNMDQLEVKIYVPEKQLHRVARGMEVAFTDTFLKDSGVHGSISYISGKAEFTPKNIESKENKQEMVYEVRVAVNDPSGTVKPGMFLDVELKEATQ